jgi:hypothetical protein
MKGKLKEEGSVKEDKPSKVVDKIYRMLPPAAGAVIPYLYFVADAGGRPRVQAFSLQV